jgi:hypothetical protein
MYTKKYRQPRRLLVHAQGERKSEQRRTSKTSKRSKYCKFLRKDNRITGMFRVACGKQIHTLGIRFCLGDYGPASLTSAKIFIYSFSILCMCMQRPRRKREKKEHVALAQCVYFSWRVTCARVCHERSRKKDRQREKSGGKRRDFFLFVLDRLFSAIGEDTFDGSN